MYPIGWSPGFHLQGIETEIRTFPKLESLFVTDSVKINQPGLVKVVRIDTFWPGHIVSATTFARPGLCVDL